uniref:Small ribosomal subunit protein uS9c n=1 Tax=Bulboplastis apyrenoidosa TaxID=1070855 RepID=A0A1Y9TM66_9RHOD|nr:30S ribosomal protein S9 [Bulboplastis apyrenoidosa]ARO90721.1 30S ribosomal protein S9 [Bulboplastis apyrenoidosa]
MVDTNTNPIKISYYGTGRRKASIARVYVIYGSGNVFINGQLGIKYLQYNASHLNLVLKPLKLLSLDNKYDLMISTKGGGLTGQANAIKLGVARALCTLDPNNRSILKSSGMLTRDSRVYDTKKYGLRKARKAPQFSKR